MNNLEPSFRFAYKGEGSALISIQSEALRQLANSHYSDQDIETWISGLDPDQYEEAIAQQEIIVCLSASTIVGFGHYKKEWQEIKELYIEPHSSRKGIGKKLEQQLEQLALENKAELLRTFASLNAQPFYQVLGFDYIQETSLEVAEGYSLPFIQMEKKLAVNNP